MFVQNHHSWFRTRRYFQNYDQSGSKHAFPRITIFARSEHAMTSGVCLHVQNLWCTVHSSHVQNMRPVFCQLTYMFKTCDVHLIHGTFGTCWVTVHVKNMHLYHMFRTCDFHPPITCSRTCGMNESTVTLCGFWACIVLYDRPEPTFQGEGIPSGNCE